MPLPFNFNGPRMKFEFDGRSLRNTLEYMLAIGNIDAPRLVAALDHHLSKVDSPELHGTLHRARTALLEYSTTMSHCANLLSNLQIATAIDRTDAKNMPAPGDTRAQAVQRLAAAINTRAASAAAAA